MVKTHDEIAAWLEEDDARSRPYRAERLRFLLQHLDPETMTEFYRGEMAFLAFEEARRAFVHGLFVACTVLTQVCVEHTLGGLFLAASRDDLDRATFDLLREGRNERYLSEEEFKLFDRLRIIRNPYVHSRPPVSENSLHLRAMQVNREPDELAGEDAKLAITALLRFLGRLTIRPTS